MKGWPPSKRLPVPPLTIVQRREARPKRWSGTPFRKKGLSSSEPCVVRSLASALEASAGTFDATRDDRLARASVPLEEKSSRTSSRVRREILSPPSSRAGCFALDDAQAQTSTHPPAAQRPGSHARPPDVPRPPPQPDLCGAMRLAPLQRLLFIMRSAAARSAAAAAAPCRMGRVRRVRRALSAC